MKAKELIAEAISLPVEQRAVIVDSLLRSLDSPGADVDGEWLAEAERRLEQVRSGHVVLVPADDVFAQIKKRFTR